MTISTLLLAAQLWSAVATTRDTHPPDVVGAVPVMVVDAAQRAGVCPRLAIAVMWRESRGRPDGQSHCCIGPMQVSPRYHCTTPDCGGLAGQITAGVDALHRYTARYGLRQGLRTYACGARRRDVCGGWYADQVLSLYTQLEQLP
jgi:hypothetical protein